MNDHFRLAERNWAEEIDAGLSRDHGDVRIVSPFIKVGAIARILRRLGNARLRVVTRYKLDDFNCGVSDIDALRGVIRAGGEVRGIKGLHSKLYIFGSDRAIVTSANLTEAGLLRNREFGFVTTDSAIVAECSAYCDRLWAVGRDDLSEVMLDDWQQQLLHARRSASPALGPPLPDYGLEAGADAPPPLTSISSSSGKAFIKFFGSGDNRALRSLTILDELTRSGSHWACTYPKRPRGPSDGDIIFMARMVKSPDDYIIYGQAIGRKHVDSTDVASDLEIERRPWKVNWPYYVRVHHPRFVNGDLHNGVSMNRLMAELGSQAFVSTQTNARRGRGNTEPRRALMQQPAVELTSDALAWLSTEFGRAVDVYGQIDLTDTRLDWPD